MYWKRESRTTNFNECEDAAFNLVLCIHWSAYFRKLDRTENTFLQTQWFSSVRLNWRNTMSLSSSSIACNGGCPSWNRIPNFLFSLAFQTTLRRCVCKSILATYHRILALSLVPRPIGMPYRRPSRNRIFARRTFILILYGSGSDKEGNSGRFCH